MAVTSPSGAMQLPKPKARPRMSKVRTGCRTCKTRRVKCDEARPVCMRCEKLQIQCGGYDIVRVPKVLPQNARPIAPRDNDTTTAVAVNLPATTPPENANSNAVALFAPRSPPSKPRFGSEREAKYFHLFCQQTATHLAGYFDRTLWEMLVLQASDEHSSIRHAVVAIAALDITSREALAGRDSIESTEETSRHHRFAILQYSRAISEMREEAKRAKTDLRTTLITSLLIITFESYHGNHSSAVSQIQIALDLLEAAKKKSDPTFSDKSIEENLIQAFIRMDVQARSFTALRPVNTKDVIIKFCTDMIENMPESFATLDQARNTMEPWLQQILTFFGSVFLDPEGGGARKISDEIMRIAATGKFMLLTAVAQWEQSFKKFWQKSCEDMKRLSILSKPELRCLLASISLRLHYLAGVSNLKLIHTNEFPAADPQSVMPHYAEVLRLVRIVLAYSSTVQLPRKFNFDCQVIAPLYLCAWRSPDRFQRREAIAILLASSRREGFWDGMTTGKLTQWYMSIEEEGLEDDERFIPQERRVTGLEMDLDLFSRRAYVKCLQPDPSSPGDFIPRKATLSW